MAKHMMEMGGKAGMINKAQASEPKTPRAAPAGAHSTPKAKKPMAAEMGSGGLSEGIKHLKRNHAPQKAGGGAKYY